MGKILMIGSDNVFAIENFYFTHLKSIGADVERFAAANIFFDYYQGIKNKVLFKLGLSPIYKQINLEFKKWVLKVQPDLIWIFKGMEIYPKSLKWARNKGIKLVNYNPDNPFLFSGKGSGNKNVTRSIHLYDLHFTYHRGVKKRIEEEFGIKSALLPFGFDDNEELYLECKKEDEVIGVCFLGNPDIHRAKFLYALASAGLDIHIYGNEHSKWIAHPKIKLFPAVHGLNQWRVLRRYRVQLNMMRLHNLDSHNMRSFEVPGIGGIMLAPDTPDHRAYFSVNEEIFVYKDVNDAEKQIRYILGLSLKEADLVRSRARQRSISSGYSYFERAKYALSTFEKLLTAH